MNKDQNFKFEWLKITVERLKFYLILGSVTQIVMLDFMLKKIETKRLFE